MRNVKIATLVAFLALVAIVAVTQLKGQPSQQNEQAKVPEVEKQELGKTEVACVPASLSGQTVVHGLGIDFPLVPDADRLSYGDVGSVQYRVNASPSEVMGFYHDRVIAAMCGKLLSYGHNTATYQAGEGVVKIAASNPTDEGRTVIAFELINARKVLGESYVQIAQADMSCPDNQIRCYGSDGISNWCQASPCPTYTSPTNTNTYTPPPSNTNTYTPPPSTEPGSCTGGMTWCASTSGSGGWCQYPPCPSTTYTPPSSPTCSGAYQQSGSTYASCNYSACPNGCSWGSDGCPSGCYTPQTCTGDYQQTGSSYPNCNYTKCPNGCNWSNGCPSGCYAAPVCSGTFAMTGTSSCNYATCPNGCSWDSTGCPSGCYTPATCTGEYQQTGSAYPMCNYSKCPSGCNYGSNGCPSSCMVTCPAGQYSCNGACVSNTTSCNSPTPITTCTSGQYWCNGACIANGSTCSGTGTTKATCESGGGLWCQPSFAPHCHPGPNPGQCESDSAPVVACSSGQYWCNGACVASGTSCTPTAWPTDQAGCTSSGKYWCTSTSGFAGGSGWCQSSSCTTTPTSCAQGMQWCSYTNSCMSTSVSCVPPPPPTPQIQCGQCQVVKDGACVKAPAGTADSRCGTGAVCDQYGGCVTLSTTMKFVGNGAICGDKFCSPELGENRENCPSECRNDPQPLLKPEVPLPPVNANVGVPPQPRIIEPGPSEEELDRMRQQDFKNMKKNVEQFAKGVERMRKYIQSAKTRLARSGVGIPVELENALAKAPELLAKLRAAKDFEEFELIMQDMQDIAMELDEWRTSIGDLDRLAGSLTQLNRDVRRMGTEFNLAKARVKGKAELQEPFKELEALFGVLSKRAADVRKLAKSDPEQSLELADAFYEDAQDFWGQVSLLNMLRDVRRSLTLANTEMARAVRRVDQFARVKGVDPALIVELRAILQQIKDLIPELKVAISAKPLDFELVQGLAEQFQELIKEFEDLMAENGRGQYVPTVQRGTGVDIVIPEGFINTYSPPPSTLSGGASPNATSTPPTQ